MNALRRRVAPSVGPITVAEPPRRGPRLPQEPDGTAHMTGLSSRADGANPAERDARLAQPHCQPAGGLAGSHRICPGELPGLFQGIFRWLPP